MSRWHETARAVTRTPGIRPVYQAYLRRRVPGLAASHAYDREMSEILARSLAPRSNCVDVGAHAGDVLDVILKYAPQGAHHAFEPLPEFAARLRRRYPGVSVHDVALSKEPGRAEFVNVISNPAYSGLRRRGYVRPERLRMITVDVARLDDSLSPELPIAFLKIDVEGAEVDVLRGATRTLAAYRPLTVFEYGQGSTSFYDESGPEELHEIFTDAGMAVNTMARWLRGIGPYTRNEFIEHYVERRGFYLMGQPAGTGAPS